MYAGPHPHGGHLPPDPSYQGIEAAQFADEAIIHGGEYATCVMEATDVQGWPHTDAGDAYAGAAYQPQCQTGDSLVPIRALPSPFQPLFTSFM